MFGWLTGTRSISSVTFFSPSIKAQTMRKRVGAESRLNSSAAISNTRSSWWDDSCFCIKICQLTDISRDG